MGLEKCVLLWLCLAGPASLAQQGDRVDLGRLQTGAKVSFVRAAGGEWGVEIAGGAAPLIQQPKPAQVEVFRTEDDIRPLAAGYKTLKKSASGIMAQAEIAYGDNVVFRVQDHWSLDGAVVSLRRKVEVAGNAPGGFDSSIVLDLDPAIGWSNVSGLFPGALYGDPTYDGAGSPGGTQNYAARRFFMREDMLPAPMFALSFSNGASVAVLDPAPRGDSTVAETRLSSPVMTDARFEFGAMGYWQADQQPIEFGFRFPGTVTMSARGRGGGGPAQVDPALSSDFAGSGTQLPGAFSLRTERILPGRDAERLALGLEHVEPASQLY